MLVFVFLVDTFALAYKCSLEITNKDTIHYFMCFVKKKMVILENLKTSHQTLISIAGQKSWCETRKRTDAYYPFSLEEGVADPRERTSSDQEMTVPVGMNCRQQFLRRCELPMIQWEAPQRTILVLVEDGEVTRSVHLDPNFSRFTSHSDRLVISLDGEHFELALLGIPDPSFRF